MSEGQDVKEQPSKPPGGWNRLRSLVFRQEPSSKEELPKTPIYAKDIWVDAYLEANSLWPQTNFAISFMTAAAVFADPPGDWNDFFYSTLSPTQLQRLNQKMSDIHHAFGIPVATATHAKEGDKVLPYNELQGFWQGNIGYLSNVLNRFMDKRNWNHRPNEKERKEIEDFLKGKTHSGRADTMREMFAIGMEVLNSPGGKEFAKMQKYAVLKRRGFSLQHDKETYILADELAVRYMGEQEVSLWKKSIYKDPAHFMKHIIRKSILERFSGYTHDKIERLLVLEDYRS